jgi:hypothetical protein
MCSFFYAEILAEEISSYVVKMNPSTKFQSAPVWQGGN